jgi:hypothetical protein
LLSKLIADRRAGIKAIIDKNADVVNNKDKKLE